MKIALYMIAGGDFKQAGSATSNLKKMLKKINIDPADMRRVIIAAFEAEMNVVIHARKGSMRVILDANEIEIEVRDEGPGISDIEQAMKEGFSTAPPAARALGYGAGMGLPNIKNNSDSFEIDSAVGEGTRLCFTINFKTHESYVWSRNSVRSVPEKCHNCLFCVRNCPTKAIRVRNNKPEILRELCIDCTSCIKICRSGALVALETGDEVKPSPDKFLVVSPQFLSQFSAKISPQRVLAALDKMGFKNVFLTEAWENALREAVYKYAEQEEKSLPVITPLCPAVVNLIELRFPTLTENIAPFLSPIEAVRKNLMGLDTLILAGCPSHLTALLAKQLSRNVEVVIPSTLRQSVQPLVMDAEDAAAPEIAPEGASRIEVPAGVLEVSGIRHVINVLEKVENGRLRDVRVLELFVCDQGCFGSPLLSEEPFVARYRWGKDIGRTNEYAKAIRRDVPFRVRAGMRLDQDVSRAIVKFAEVDDLTAVLPGIDCGMCGAPTCAALAEDIVMNRAARSDCVHFADDKGGLQ